MRIHLAVLGSALLGSTAFAQSFQPIEIQGSETSFTSRGDVGTAAGETLQGFHGTHWLGLLEDGTTSSTQKPKCEIASFVGVYQDENCATNETFDLVVRTGDEVNGPTAGNAGLLGQVLGLSMPNPPLSGRCGWLQSVAFTAAGRIQVPCGKFFAVGTRYAPAPNWPGDGVSTHACYGSASYPHQNSWTQTAFSSQPQHDWQFVGASTTATHASDFRSWRYAIGTTGVTLQGGVANSFGVVGYGTGGMFPIASTQAAPRRYEIRLAGGGGFAGGASVVLLAPAGLLSVPVALGSGASLYVDPTVAIVFFGAPADGAGASHIPIAPFVPPLGLPVGTKVPFQGAMQARNNGPLKLSNVQFVEPQ